MLDIVGSLKTALQYADEAYAIYNRLSDAIKSGQQDLHPTDLEDARARLRNALDRADKAAASLDAAIARKLEE